MPLIERLMMEMVISVEWIAFHELCLAVISTYPSKLSINLNICLSFFVALDGRNWGVDVPIRRARWLG